MESEEVAQYIEGKTIASVEMEGLFDFNREHERIVLNFKDGSRLIIQSNAFFEESELVFKKGTEGKS